MINQRENLEKALVYGRGRGCQEVECYLQESLATSLEIRNGSLDKYEEAASKGVGVRVIRGNKQALVFGTSLEEEDLCRAIDEAYDIADYLDEDQDLFLHEKDEFTGAIEEEEAQAIANTHLDEKIAYLVRMEKNAKQENVLMEGTAYSENQYATTIINSRGLYKKETGAYCGASVSLAINHKGVNETGYSYCYTRSLAQLLKRDLGKEAYTKAKEMLGAEGVTTGKYPVLFDREVVISLLGLLAYSFNGENIYKGKSLFKGKEGQKVLSSNLHIIDDGTRKGFLGETNFDGDGLAVSPNVLVASGVFQGGLYNLAIGRKTGRQSTGNCQRSYASLPSIGHHNLFIEKGGASVEGMIQTIQNGLVIKDLMGLHMANPITGEFSLGASGLLIKKGKLDKGFRGVTVSGNLLQLFSSIAGIGDDFYIETSKGAPSLFVKDVIISGS